MSAHLAAPDPHAHSHVRRYLLVWAGLMILTAVTWFMSPWDYQGLLAIYHIIQWILVGLVLAIGIKPKSRPVQV